MLRQSENSTYYVFTVVLLILLFVTAIINQFFILYCKNTWHIYMFRNNCVCTNYYFLLLQVNLKVKYFVFGEFMELCNFREWGSGLFKLECIVHKSFTV